MAISQARSKRKPTGSRYVDFRKKTLHELGRDPTMTKVGEKRSKTLRTRGGSSKEILLTHNVVNLFIPKTKKYEKVKIDNVLENPANRHFVRRNILTKGTIIQTSKGKARVSGRPGQEGMVNAVLVE